MNGDKPKRRQREVPVPKAMLTIAGPDRVDEVLLERSGVVIGRSAKCDVVLKSERVSRRHARIYQDPFGRWIVEDLDSQNGVLIGGQLVRAHAILPGQKITIGPFTLTLFEQSRQQIPADPQVSSSTHLIEPAADMEVVREGITLDARLPGTWLKELNRIVDRLGELTAPTELYPEVCRCLAAAHGTAALVVRLPEPDDPLPASPEVVACHLGESRYTPPGAGKWAADGFPTPATEANLHLSRRVLEAVRTAGEPVMARSAHATDGVLMLTITDTRTPRAVFCAPLSEPRGSLDALYLDVPFEKAAPEVFDFVQAVARQVRLVRNSLLMLELKTQRRTLDRQLEMAQEIQGRLTPSALPKLPGVEVAVRYQPAMWVGGDYCDVWLLPDERLAFAVGDVSGKGLPAAMVMSNLQAALRTAASFCPHPSDAMEHVNGHLRRHLPENMFVTMFFGLFQPHDGQLEYVNAGHIPPLLIGPHAPAEWLDRPRNCPLGVSDEAYTTGTETLEPGASLLVVTDGVTEAGSSPEEQFGMERLKELPHTARARSAQQLVEAVTQAAVDFRGLRPQQDDITVFALSRPGA